MHTTKLSAVTAELQTEQRSRGPAEGRPPIPACSRGVPAVTAELRNRSRDRGIEPKARQTPTLPGTLLVLLMAAPAAAAALSATALRIKDVKAACAASLQEICTHGILDASPAWQLAACLLKETDPDAIATAGAMVLLAPFHSDLKKAKNDEVDRVADELRKASEPPDGWPLGADNFPAGNNAATRAMVRALAEQLHMSRHSEVGQLTHAAAAPLTVAATGPAATATGTPSAGSINTQNVSIRSAAERDEERVTTCRGWYNKQTPKPPQWPNSVQPSQKLLVRFQEWKIADAPPAILPLTDYTKDGRPSGYHERPSPLVDLICVLLAMAQMYAIPMPAGFRQDSDDTTFLEWEEEQVDPANPAGPKIKVTVRRPACLSAAILAEVIAYLTVALAPLSDPQQDESIGIMWGDLSAAARNLQGHTYSTAFRQAFFSNAMRDTLRAEPVLATPRRIGGRRRDDDDGDERPTRKRRSSDLQQREHREEVKRQKQERPVCKDWEKTGTCKLHDKLQHKTHKHPEKWRSTGKPKE